MIKLAIFLCILSFILWGVDYIYHLSDLKKINLTPNTDFRIIRAKFSKLSAKKYDDFIGVFPFIWTYFLIISSILVFSEVNNFLLKIFLILFVTGRYRSLQEIGHFAVHGSLCRKRNFGMWIANIFYQFPLFMPEAYDRRVTHVKIHHNCVNMSYDPDLIELIDKGFNPGISTFSFWRGVFYPLTFKGIKDRIKECLKYLSEKPFSLSFFVRTFVISSIFFLFTIFGFYQELIFLYILPVLFLYPLYYWIAHISLHRWFAECVQDVPYFERELILGRPTEFKGIIGFIIRHNLFPFGDSYHLAHSLFPAVRWNYLPQIDRILKEKLPDYSKNMTCNLFLKTQKHPSILSDLKERFIKRF